MKKVMLCTAAIALLGLGGIAQANITIETVAIGGAGNAGELSGAGVGGDGPDRICGAVAYNYNIGKYEVTAGQYTDFLNNKASVSDTYGLYSIYMDTVNNSSGCNIKRTGNSGSYSYSVASDYANRPVNYVSYWDSLRFTNWLGNGQGNSSTETGAYTLNNYNGTDGRTIQRNTGATWAVTSEDEWYKAAYYKGNGLYSVYANGTSVAPVAGTDSNYYNGVSVGSTWDGTTSGALEQNGTKDMMGNVWEWNEAILYISGNYACRGLRGGSFIDYYYYLQSSNRYNYSDPSFEHYDIGFRVSEVPEPSSIIALLGGLTGLIGLRRRYV
ncbi:MAG: SUMF1/EgtB/PvdO family nonheme iron enzyme [Armatimonadetes bacterium]|nr:SUMF1/EgtB/PvdO family nonheme iron enzyme [Armatimonadota bacterium]